MSPVLVAVVSFLRSLPAALNSRRRGEDMQPARFWADNASKGGDRAFADSYLWPWYFFPARRRRVARCAGRGLADKIRSAVCTAPSISPGRETMKRRVGLSLNPRIHALRFAVAITFSILPLCAWAQTPNGRLFAGEPDWL